MAKFTPNSSSFNTTNINQIATTDRVQASFVNGYYQTFINNDAYNKAVADKMMHVTTVTLSKNTGTGNNVWKNASPPYVQVVPVTGVTANDYGVPSIKYGDTCNTWAKKKAIDKSARYLTKCVTGAGTITFYAVDLPTENLTIELRGI